MTGLIDFHSHHVPARYELTTLRNFPASQRARWERLNRRLADPEALTEAIDSGDLAGRVVNIPTALFTDQNEVPPPALFRDVNDQLAELVASRPGLHGLASVDAFSGDEGARELTRAVRKLGLRGVFVESSRGDLLLDAPEARPTLEAAAELRVPVFAHPINPQPLTARMSQYGQLGTLWARGTVNEATLVALLGSGTLDRLPDLRLVVTTLAIGAVMLAGAFSELPGRQIHIDTMAFQPALIRAAVDLLGAERVLAGSDWPILSDGPIAGKLAAALARAGIGEADAALIAGGNARRLLGGGSGD
jgi:aminocarboxymuconate-semialdehyde decarboxylase